MALGCSWVDQLPQRLPLLPSPLPTGQWGANSDAWGPSGGVGYKAHPSAIHPHRDGAWSRDVIVDCPSQ